MTLADCRTLVMPNASRTTPVTGTNGVYTVQGLGQMLHGKTWGGF